jgi:hypothetical protein
MAKGMLIAIVISLLFIALWASLPRMVEVSDTFIQQEPTLILPSEWERG